MAAKTRDQKGNKLEKMLDSPDIPEDAREVVKVFIELIDKRDKEGWNPGEREEIRYYLKNLIDKIKQ